LTHMGPSMLTRLDEVEHTCANDSLTARSETCVQGYALGVLAAVLVGGPPVLWQRT